MNIYEKLIKIQAEIKAPKSQRNEFGKYNYRNCEDILEAVKPLLKTSDCVVLLSDDVIVIGSRYYVKAVASLIDTETGDKVETSALAREEETKKGMDGSQITGASSSYARKYALNALFAIDDTKDSDATNKGDKEDKVGVSKPTRIQLDKVKALEINLENTAKHFKKAVSELTCEEVQGAIEAKERYLEKQKEVANES